MAKKRTHLRDALCNVGAPSHLKFSDVSPILSAQWPHMAGGDHAEQHK